MVKNFRFEEPTIALSGVPATPEAVDWLHEQGIRTVVSLHPVGPEIAGRLAERGIAWRPFLLTGFTDTVPAGLVETLDFIRARAAADPAVLIH
jgi:hypothetical protein